MGSIGEPQATVPTTIPVIDFSKWNSSTSKEEQLAVAKELTDACREVGFAYIINHGLPQDLLDRVFDTSKKLYDLSHEEKMQAPHPDGPDVHRGYSYPGLEKVSQYMGSDEKVAAKERQTRDCKESYENWERGVGSAAECLASRTDVAWISAIHDRVLLGVQQNCAEHLESDGVGCWLGCCRAFSQISLWPQ